MVETATVWLFSCHANKNIQRVAKRWQMHLVARCMEEKKKVSDIMALTLISPRLSEGALNLPLCISVCAVFVCVRLFRGEE